MIYLQTALWAKTVIRLSFTPVWIVETAAITPEPNIFLDDKIKWIKNDILTIVDGSFY